jgi:CBS domain-containing protein
MTIAEKNIATLQRENSIKHAADLMAKKKTRRVFVTDPNGKLRGVVTAKDIVDFLGGGDRSKIIRERHQGNLLSAVNEPVRLIMTEKVNSLKTNDSIEDAIKIMQKTKRGGIPILDDEKLVAMATEKRLARLISKSFSEEIVRDHMSEKIIFGTTGMRVADVSKVMIRNGFRKLPVLSERKLVGTITAQDIVAAFSKDLSSKFLVTRVDKIMTKPISVPLDTAVIDAAEVMRKNKISGLSVVENEKVVGMFTESDLIRTL